jgi:methylated-DNA-[protein]-cysteine S-methyltransferase
MKREDTMKLTYGLQQGSHGWVAALASEQGLRSVSLPQPSPERALDNLGKELDRAVQDDGAFAGFFRRVEAYFNGQPETFAEDLPDPDLGTDFQRRVWSALRTIPYGETRSYGWVAEQVGVPQAPRAAGRAIGSNKVVLVVPCQRVIGASGDLRGYGAGGLGVKQRLLDLEQTGKKGAVTVS